MRAYAWLYVDYDNEVLYWSYSGDMSTTEFAEAVSNKIGKRVNASDTSYVNGMKELEKKLRHYISIQL